MGLGAGLGNDFLVAQEAFADGLESFDGERVGFLDHLAMSLLRILATGIHDGLLRLAKSAGENLVEGRIRLVEERTDCPFGQRTSDLADLALEGFPETLLGVDERFDRALFRFKQRLEAAEFFGVGDLRLPGGGDVRSPEVLDIW